MREDSNLIKLNLCLQSHWNVKLKLKGLLNTSKYIQFHSKSINATNFAQAIQMKLQTTYRTQSRVVGRQIE